MMHIKNIFFYTMYTCPLPSASPAPAAVILTPPLTTDLGYPETTNLQYRDLDKDVNMILRTLENEGSVSYNTWLLKGQRKKD